MTAPTKPQTTLLPCPFCGAKAATGRNYGIGGCYIRCSNIQCPASPEIFLQAKEGKEGSLCLDEAFVETAKLWNERHAG